MNILLVEDDVAVGRCLAATLTRAGHTAEVALDGKTALQRLRSCEFDAVVSDWLLPDLDGTAIVREIRSWPGTQPLAILVSGLDGPMAKSHAERIGADAFLTKPVAGAALLNSLTVGLAKRTTTRASGALPVVSTRAWRELPSSLSATLSDCTGLEFAPSLRRSLPPELAVRTSMLMVDVKHQVEVEVLLYTPADSARSLAEVMLRVQNADIITMRELLTELCNNVLGVLKRGAGQEGFDFTLSLADRGEPPLPADLSRSFGAMVTHSFTGGGVEICVCTGVRPTPTSAVRSSGLKENMVLAENVINEKGILILPIGTRLTVSSAERVARHLPNRSVRVCGVAA